MQAIPIKILAKLLGISRAAAAYRYRSAICHVSTGKGRGGKTAVIPAHAIENPTAEIAAAMQNFSTPSPEQIHYQGAWRVSTLRAAVLCGVSIKAFRSFTAQIGISPISQNGTDYWQVDGLGEEAQLEFYGTLQQPDKNPREATAHAKQYQNASQAMRHRADQRLNCLRTWQELRNKSSDPNVDRDFIAAWNLKSDLKISRSSLYRWWSNFKEHGIDGLVEKYSRSPKRTAEFSEEAKAYLASLWLDEARRDAYSCFQNLRAIAKLRNWKIPSYPTCHRYLQSFSKDVVLLLREGKKSFEDAGFPAIQRDHESITVGDLYVADDRMLDVSFGEGKKDQRVWVTVWMDFRTKKVLSLVFPQKGNNAGAVLDGFYEAAMIHIPEKVYLDNGSNYKAAASLQNKEEEHLPETLRAPIAKLLGEQNVKWALSENARTKLVERIFVDMARVHDKNLPGYTGMNILKRPEAWYLTRENSGFLDRHQVIEYVREYFFNKHNNRVNKSGKTPNQIWADHFKTAAFRRTEPEYLRHLLLRTYPKPIKIRANGIQFGVQSNGRARFYWDDALQLFTAKHEEVLVKYNENDPERIWIYALDGTPLAEVPLYFASRVHVLEGKTEVRQYYGKKRGREKQIRAMKKRLDDLHGINFSPETLMQRDDIAPEPELNVDKATGEIIENVEHVPLNIEMPESITSRRLRVKENEQTARQVQEKIITDVRPEVEIDSQDVWQRLFQNI